MVRSSLTSILFVLLAGVLGACPEGGGPTDATTPPPEAPCSCLDGNRYSCGELTNCGTFVTCYEWGDTGGGDTVVCEQLKQDRDNAEVVACILDSDANGVGVQFAHSEHGYTPLWTEWTEHHYWLPANSPVMWSSETGEADVACWDRAWVREAVTFDGCHSWGCIEQRVESKVIETCRDDYEDCGA